MSTTTHDFKPTKVVASEQPETNFKMIAENVTITYGGVPAVENVTMKFKEKSVIRPDVARRRFCVVLTACMI